MPSTNRHELVHRLLLELDANVDVRSSVSVFVAAALLAGATTGLLADAMQLAVTTGDRQFVAIATAHLAGDHDRVDALARDHLLDHEPRPVLAWIVERSQAITNNQGDHR